MANFTIRGNLSRIDRHKIFMAIKEACSFVGICACRSMRISIQFSQSAIQLALNGLFLKFVVRHYAIGANYFLLLKSSDEASFYDLAENLKLQISWRMIERSLISPNLLSNHNGSHYKLSGVNETPKHNPVWSNTNQASKTSGSVSCTDASAKEHEIR
jgi:hypothetical protein